MCVRSHLFSLLFRYDESWCGDFNQKVQFLTYLLASFTWNTEGLWVGSHTGLCLTTNGMSKLWNKCLKCSVHFSRDCHPVMPAFKIQQTITLGHERQNQCGKHTAVIEKYGVENMLLSVCYKHNLYKRETAKGFQRRCLSPPGKPCISAKEKSQWHSQNTNSTTGTIPGASLLPYSLSCRVQ